MSRTFDALAGIERRRALRHPRFAYLAAKGDPAGTGAVQLGDDGLSDDEWNEYWQLFDRSGFNYTRRVLRLLEKAGPRAVARTFRHRWQRSRRGFSDDDIGELGAHLARVVHSSVARFRTVRHGRPAQQTEAEWNRRLGEIVVGFEAAERLARHDHDPEQEAELLDQSRRGAARLVEHLGDLWD